MTACRLHGLRGGGEDPAGFTLLEVLIAISIMATILVILFGAYSAAVDRATRSREVAQIYHEARVLLQLIANDLRSTYIKESVEQAQQAFQQVKARPTILQGDFKLAASTDRAAPATLVRLIVADGPLGEKEIGYKIFRLASFTALLAFVSIAIQYVILGLR